MLDLIIFPVLLALGYGFGRHAETRHYQSIIAREKKLQSLPAVGMKVPPLDRPYTATLVCGNVVISVDYFKRFLAGLRSLFGGRVTSYESLLDRARREAILRMKEQAEGLGAKLIFNVKLTTASLSRGKHGKTGSIEVLAYGTALIE